MDAIHWLRSRQEERELFYWLSFVAYDSRDQSLNNRIYLGYLIIFFSIWVFAVLTFFADGGAVFLSAIHPANHARGAALIEAFLLAVWSLFSLWQALRRSPVVFSDQDMVLLCQMPVSRRQVVMRWWFMPWLKSAIPFWIAAVTLGFSLAEATLPGEMGIHRLPEYIGFGLRAWLPILPLHLALFTLHWLAGVSRLQSEQEKRWPVVAWAVFLLSTVWVLRPGATPATAGLAAGMEAIVYPLQAGFGQGNPWIAASMVTAIAGGLLGLLAQVSGAVSISRAAQETQETEQVNTALRHGLSGYTQQMHTRQRLGVSRPPSRLPAPGGAAALIWKDLVQSQRTFQLTALFDWAALFFVMFSLPFLPDFGSRGLALAFWAIQVGKVSVTRVRSDLACWPLFRQLPISSGRLLLFDTAPAYLVVILLSLTALGAGTSISGALNGALAGLVPGMAAGVMGMAVYDVLRRSHSNLLLTGTVPEVSASGILLGLLCAALPLTALVFLPAWVGIFTAFLISLGMAGLSYFLALHAYRNIDSA